MNRQTREQQKRAWQMAPYKKRMMYGYAAIAVLLVGISIFFLYKMNRFEKKLDDIWKLENGQNMPLGYGETTSSNSNTRQNAVQSVLGQAAPDSGETSGESMQEDSGTTHKDASQLSSEQVKRVYLTFDDGPSDYTGEILDILAANDIKASFFVIGKEEEYYDAYKRIVEEGHTIGLHSFSHVYQDFYESEESFAAELTELNDLLYDVTGTRSTIFRFPGGSSNTVAPLPIQTYIAYLNEQGIRYYDWNALNGDAVTNGLSPWQLVNNIMKDVRKNQDSIVLMHDLQTTHATVESLQLLIDTLKESGYEILPIDEDTPLIQHVSYKTAEE